MMKFLTVSLNPAVDRTMYFDSFSAGRLNRAKETVMTAGSKGQNVARALKLLGSDVRLLSFSGGMAGPFLEEETRREGIPATFFPCRAGVRLNIKMIDGSGNGTEANESGGPVTEEEEAAIRAELLRLADRDTVVVLNGSVPPGIPKRIYRDYTEALTKKGARVIADCDGEALSEVLKARPHLIKPNVFEMKGLVGSELGEIRQIPDAAAEIAARSGTDVICTVGEKGSVYVSSDGEERYFVTAPSHIPVRGFSGAGDTYLAAYLHYRMDRKRSVPDALCLASAMAAAKVSCPGTSVPEDGSWKRYLDEIRITAITHKTSWDNME